MDIGNHITQGFLIGYIPSGRISIGIISAVFAAIPDAIGSYYAKVLGDYYRMRERLHNGDINMIMEYLPPWGLHTLLDRYTHSEGKRWYAGKFWEYFVPWRWKERMWVEAVTWVINAGIIIYLITRG